MKVGKVESWSTVIDGHGRLMVRKDELRRTWEDNFGIYIIWYSRAGSCSQGSL